MYPNFISHIRKHVDLDDHSATRLLKYISPLKLKRKEFLLKEGQVCQIHLFCREKVVYGCIISIKN